MEASRVAPEEKMPLEPGKPDFPLLTKTQDLKDFVGPQSWLLVDRLGDKGEWLIKNPSEWESDPAYNAMKKVVDALHEVNDTAERGCRMADLYKVNFIHYESAYLRYPPCQNLIAV